MPVPPIPPARLPLPPLRLSRPLRPLRLLRLALLLVAGIGAGLALPARAQEAPPTSLVADSVVFDGTARVTARGRVEVLAGDIRLNASAISYDGRSGRLDIEGPIELRQGDNVVILASSAELDTDLKNGLIRSARMVLEQQLQLAAAELARADGRYTLLYKSVASSCRVCAGRAPLWEIRAERIVHDQQQRQLYFDKAQLRVAGVPVFYLPRLRMPDPTVERATGFLVPSLRTTSRLGTGVRIPYFITLGDHADVTLTPYLSPFTATLQGRYRQAFRTGRLQFDAALTSDTLLPGQLRGYLFGRGGVGLAGGYRLSYDLELTSDPGYLLDYGFSGKDRLDSDITLRRTRPADSFRASLKRLQSLRASELPIAGQLPDLLGRVSYQRRFFPPGLGGQGLWTLNADSHRRPSSADRLGRDMAHAGAALRWSRSETFGPGLVGRIGAELAADCWAVGQDSTAPPSGAQFTPTIEAELRWPWVRSGRDGAALMLEPVVHLAYSRAHGSAGPNEDSTLAELDEGNLFAMSRFAGEDRRETGLRGAFGLTWSRHDPDGWSLRLAAGRVLRATDPEQFSAASGLDGTSSDWLLAAQLKLDSRLSLTTRALLDPAAPDLTKTDTMLSWRGERLRLASTYSYVIADPAETRPDLTSQLTLDAGLRLGGNWEGSLQYRYDFAAARATRAAIGLNYTNECITVDLSLARRFTASTTVAPTTDVGLTVSLFGFGPNRGTAPRSCSGM